MRIQIFGTDLSESVIGHARAGNLSERDREGCSRSRLKRFFIKRDGSYQIHRNVRDICTFARQNITADPPFSRLDLISCRKRSYLSQPAIAQALHSAVSLRAYSGRLFDSGPCRIRRIVR